MAKTPSEPVETSSETPESGMQLASDVFSLSLRAIRDEIRSLIAGKPDGRKARGGGRAGGDVTTRIANLSARAAVLAGELRKAEKAQLAETKDLTREKVVAWARVQSKDARQRLLKDLTAIDARRSGSVLAS